MAMAVIPPQRRLVFLPGTGACRGFPGAGFSPAAGAFAGLPDLGIISLSFRRFVLVQGQKISATGGEFSGRGRGRIAPELTVGGKGLEKKNSGIGRAAGRRIPCPGGAQQATGFLQKETDRSESALKKLFGIGGVSHHQSCKCLQRVGRQNNSAGDQSHHRSGGVCHRPGSQRSREDYFVKDFILGDQAFRRGSFHRGRFRR